ncbi:carbon-nitrogen family hydrolase [Acetobacterium woodii]|uniref:Nitrilase/cyanide hydratase and apolipoprotein N-acyltransferase n=1 Tax=Acetobacterium woodii (strain ATCC 29683 / DSM 1030 / JCM 2381 / KCTC 1655 / WB1) TaxID=931626 RepID=H6LKB8_ACEWD|nr:carbon-nitrogen family hydrolase [Acetobacterium woodii]AFA47508.1 nitrilase/cyanide hydratase and apolipoprotein N-acyltransferase [Acetobacterium woodii DSM 1030]
MKIAVIQMNVELKKLDANYRKAESWINKAAAAKADVVVLPEMWSGGFLTNVMAERLADEDGQRTKDFLAKLSKKLHINIVGGSVATKKGQDYFNTCYVANREGRIIADYDKAHLFSFAGEDKRFGAGERLVTFSLDGIPCGIIICYEVRFPEWSRKQALAGTKVLFVPAEWPLKRVGHWRILNQARAIENQMFVVAVNGCGEALKDQQNGGNSMIIDPLGELLADAGTEPEEKMILADVEPSELEKVRNNMTVFLDRRPELY